MKKIYLLLIALLCAVCANAEIKTAVFDFASNPWEHGVSSSSSSDGVMAEEESLVDSDDAATLTFLKGSASSNVFRFWQANTGVQMRGYTGNICRVAVPEGGAIKSIVVTGVSGKLFTGSSFETSGTTSSITFEETTESYDITLTGNCQWTSIEVSYEIEEGPAGDPTLAETNVTDLSTLGNKKAYALKAISGEGFWCYNPDVHATNVAICGVTDYHYQGSKGNAAWDVAFDPANANHQWQILTLDGKYYLYNLGAKKYMVLNGSTYVFSDTPAEMEFRTNSESETASGISLGGTFSIRAKGSGNYGYTCICTSRSNNPVATWTYNDHGGPMVITEIENVIDGTAIEGLEALVAQQKRTAEWNELLTAAKVEYNSNNEFTEGENIIKESGYFSSNATEPNEGNIGKLLDNDCTTFWHSSWSATNGAAVAFHLHYLQVSLPEAIEGLTQLTMGRRVNDGSFCDDNPVEMSVTFSADNETFSEPTYFSTPFNQTIANPYVKATFEVPAGTKYLRFYNEKSNGNQQRGYWHCGEFQLNPVELDPTCVNAQNAEAAEDFGMILEQCDEKDPATIAEEHIAILKAALANYHYETYTYTAAELNALAKDVKAKVGEVEVVYVNGQYNYIQDESGIALLFDQAKSYTLQAGDKVKGLAVVSSPYNGLPEVKPVSEFADLTVEHNEEYTFAPAVATAVPTAEGANKIFKYVGVVAKADATFSTTSATNMTGVWQENELTFRNAFKHLETAFEEGKSYTIVAATAVYNDNVQLYVISAEEETSTTSVTYNVTFNGETIKSQTITETVGQAPTFDVTSLNAPAYVTVAALPETIEEGVTEVTVETTLNEQAPFEMGKEYVVYFYNGNYYYWNNDNGIANEVRQGGDPSDISIIEQLYSDYDHYRWTMGGDWLNGFTFTNDENLSIVAPATLSAGAAFNMSDSEATHFDMKLQSNGFYRFYIHGNETFYMAHTSHGSHRVAMWNTADYGITAQGGASCVQFLEYVPLAPVETKTVTINFVTTTGDKYMFVNKDGALELVEYSTTAPANAIFESTLWTNGKYTFTNTENYLGFNRMDSEFKPILNYWEVLSLEGVEGSAITETVPEGSVYLKVANRADGNTSVGVFVMKVADHSFNAANAPFFRSDYTSAILIEPVSTEGIGTVLRSETSSEVIYNLQGQRLNEMKRGINVVGGKKVLK